MLQQRTLKSLTRAVGVGLGREEPGPALGGGGVGGALELQAPQERPELRKARRALVGPGLEVHIGQVQGRRARLLAVPPRA